MQRVVLTCSLLLLVLSFPSLLFSQDNTPSYSNEFLAIGVGARGLAMSSAQVAVTNDVTSGYWNPAGLTQIEHDYEFSLMHASYFAGIANFDYAAFSYR